MNFNNYILNIDYQKQKSNGAAIFKVLIGERNEDINRIVCFAAGAQYSCIDLKVASFKSVRAISEEAKSKLSPPRIRPLRSDDEWNDYTVLSVHCLYGKK
jgi:hypothetical protein